MSFAQKNVTVSLVTFSAILAFFSFRIGQMLLTDSFIAGSVFTLWGVVIGLAILVTIFATILTHIAIAILEAIRTRREPEVEGVEDERDKLIELRGTWFTYRVASLGCFIAMLTFVFGQPGLVMFTLLIFSGLVAQIVGDIYRLRLYRKAF